MLVRGMRGETMEESAQKEEGDPSIRDEADVLRRRVDRLSGRERATMAELMRGRTVAEVAGIEGCSEAELQERIAVILGKLEVSSRLAAMAVVHLAAPRD